MTAIPPHTWDKGFDLVEPLIPPRLRERTPGAKLHRLARWMACASAEDMYRVLSTRWDPYDQLVVGHGHESWPIHFELEPLNGEFEILERMQAHELVATFVDTQLMKVDLYISDRRWASTCR